MKKVLIIAYYFPPTGGGGVQRATKFVKYLPFFGWSPIVLTVKNPDFDHFDESLLNDIPHDAKVYKAYSINLVRLYRIKKHGKKSVFDRRGKSSLNNKKRIFKSLFYPLIEAIKYLLNNFILIPDDHVFWIPFAVMKGFIIIKKEKIDAIYATGKPWSSFLIAYFLKMLTGKPYILDLRDPWTITPYDDSSINSIRKRIENFWEKVCFLQAGKVIYINEQINNSYIQYYPSIPSHRFTYITHGFDPDDFFNLKKTTNGKFTISFVGTVYSNTLPNNLLIAISSLIFKNADIKDSIKLKFVGFVPLHMREMIKDLELDDIFEIVEYLPHRESIQHMVNADALLLLLNKVKWNTNAQVSTGKLYEYLASRRPILALIPNDTDAAKLIVNLKIGKVVDPDDVNKIENTIYELYMEYKTCGLKNHAANIEQFERKNLTRQLANILNEIQHLE